MAGKAKKAPKKKGANGYQLPDPIPSGEILTDLTKKQWIIGSSIGVGGFGEIYAAAPYAGKTPKDYSAVIKIEPHGNGPLFVEMHFYMRNAKSDEIEAWKKKKKIATLGMPRFLGSGSHECHNTKYRFLVMERFGIDLWKLFLENGRVFPEHTVYKVALQIIDVLEYMHHRTYVHADIKGGNLLVDRTTQNQIYLVDFGLASHYSKKPEYKLDPKKAHNGTIEYTSRDAHMGVPTMRGDMEILAYNVVQWLCGSLPWEKNLSVPSAVQKQKEAAFADTSKFLRLCFTGTIPDPVVQFVSLLSKMNFSDTPDYEKFKSIFLKGLKDLGQSPGGKLEFAASKTTKAAKRTPKKAEPKAKKEVEETRKVPALKLKRLSTDANPMNDSMEIMNKSCVSGDVMKEVLSNIDPDADYEVQIKKKRRTGGRNIAEVPEKKATKATATSTKRSGKAERKKPRKRTDSEFDFEPEVITVGTKSRPRPQTTPKRGAAKDNSPRISKKNVSLDSDKDMFDDC